ncbi:A24 family peptidase C-terminal domain-containing protein [Methanoplanus endosymbiosus]|uniref:Prepilin peptidase n=1 Tax=Methanoplanus endosymbiosus TaxID=33865 RepID=A0A9E7TLX0_9EURY|nr:A24 family peptidase C-terminal domain-containing protein [Methanoplanus endosymbiosus]UUX92791.1 prepilin peptidase [Methanoplanus endosymbiosus]
MQYIEPLVISSVVVIITLLYASYRDILERRVAFKTWYPMLAVGIPMTLWAYLIFFGIQTRFATGMIIMTVIFSLMFYFMSAYLHLFGGADAWAMIFISILIPFYPLQPLWGVPPYQFFPFSVFVNAVILNLAVPVALLFYNILKGNIAPLKYMMIGYPVKGDSLTDHYGFIMEEFEEDGDEIKRRFVTYGGSLKRMVKGKRRMYTVDIRKNPEDYSEEIRLYKKAGSVWISYAVPFIIPITAGFITALIFGDILITLINILLGI